MSNNLKPIVIIGAGRSGTKILRDMLCEHSQLVTWPCDEINPTWRYKNSLAPTDELHPNHVNARFKNYIRSQFRAIRERYKGDRVVEKTCANALRVEFVHEIVPQAQFIHLIRDGRDVAASARKQWTGSTTLEYTLRKAWWSPWGELPVYGFQFFLNRLNQLFSSKSQLSTWGPRFEGIEEVVEKYSLIETCGIQWKECVEQALKGFRNVPQDQVFELRYENFVGNPIEVFREIFGFLGMDLTDQVKDALREQVTANHVGKFEKDLSTEDRNLLLSQIESTLKTLEYTE